MVRTMKYLNPGEGYSSPHDEYVKSVIPISLVQLARKWGCSEGTLMYQSSKEDWVNERKEHQKEVCEERIVTPSLAELVGDMGLREGVEGGVMGLKRFKPSPPSLAIQQHILILQVLIQEVLTYISDKPSKFDDPGYNKAVLILLDCMKLERLSRGLLSGEKPIDVEESKQYDIEQLINEWARVDKERK